MKQFKFITIILLICFAVILIIACCGSRMGQTRYNLCNTQGIGLIMFVSNLCCFPSLIPSTDISLVEPGTVLKVNFEVLVEKKL
ncbi:MAG: hypothetical protein ABFD50_02860 [Smithella sp.]